MSEKRDPDSLAAREAINAIMAAKLAGAVSQEAVTWVYSKAFEQFRKEAKVWAADQIAREKAAK